MKTIIYSLVDNFDFDNVLVCNNHSRGLKSSKIDNSSISQNVELAQENQSGKSSLSRLF